MSRYIIAIDAMGGDHAPQAIVEGTAKALRQHEEISVLLAGNPEKLEGLIAGLEDVRGRIEILPAMEVIEMDESPMMAVRKKTDSSLVRAMMAVREGKAQAAVSAGSTGAVLAAGRFKIGRIRGIERPALAPVLPGLKKPFMLIDCGANVDCQAKYINQFAMMGSVYMSSVMNVKKPDVGLLNIGTEAEKGNKVTKEAYELMSAQTAYHFAGNAEAREAMIGNFDVIAADGFDGNILLKGIEGTISALMSMMKDAMTSTLKSKIGALLVKGSLKKMKSRMDYRNHGGAPLLGVDGAVVKAHGNSNADAFASAIGQAVKMLDGQVVEKIRQGLESLGNE